MIVRCHSGLPAVGEVLEPFSRPHAVAGCMRGSYHALLMAVAAEDAHPCLGYQIHDGRLIGPRDLFDNPAFDRARQMANEAMDYFRRHGPFEPPRIDLDEMDYTIMPAVAERLADRWQRIPATAPGSPAPAGTGGSPR